MHKHKQIRAEWLCVGMSGRAGENGGEEVRGLNCITTLQTMLLRLERVELNAHGWLYKSTSHERPSAPLLWWSFKPTLMQFFSLLGIMWYTEWFSLFSVARSILLASDWEWMYLTRYEYDFWYVTVILDRQVWSPSAVAELGVAEAEGGPASWLAAELVFVVGLGGVGGAGASDTWGRV